MRYLSISKTPYYMAYAFFEGRNLLECGKMRLENSLQDERLLEWENNALTLVSRLKPTFLLTHLLNYSETLKKDIERIVEIRTILKLVALKNNVIYEEFKTSGWEKRITNLRPTKKRKLKIINDGYDLSIEDEEIANAIILGEGVAHNILQITRETQIIKPN